jgi:hypothetical protein
MMYPRRPSLARICTAAARQSFCQAAKRRSSVIHGAKYEGISNPANSKAVMEGYVLFKQLECGASRNGTQAYALQQPASTMHNLNPQPVRGHRQIACNQTQRKAGTGATKSSIRLLGRMWPP